MTLEITSRRLEVGAFVRIQIQLRQSQENVEIYLSTRTAAALMHEYIRYASLGVF